MVDLIMSLSWGMYKWLCLVCSQPSERKAEIQLLDAPMFIQRRLDPRVGVGVPAQSPHGPLGGCSGNPMKPSSPTSRTVG